MHAPLLRFAQFALGHWNIANEGNYLALAAMLPIILLGALLFYRYGERPWTDGWTDAQQGVSPASPAWRAAVHHVLLVRRRPGNALTATKSGMGRPLDSVS